jgi:hypothetical protein
MKRGQGRGVCVTYLYLQDRLETDQKPAAHAQLCGFRYYLVHVGQFKLLSHLMSDIQFFPECRRETGAIY